MATAGGRQFAAAAALPVQGYLKESKTKYAGAKRKTSPTLHETACSSSSITATTTFASSLPESDGLSNEDFRPVKHLDEAWLRSILMFRAKATYVPFDMIMSETKLKLVRKLIHAIPLAQVLVLHSALSMETTNFAVRVTCCECFRANKSVCVHAPSMPLDVYLPHTEILAPVYIWDRHSFQWQHQTITRLETLEKANQTSQVLLDAQLKTHPKVTAQELSKETDELPPDVGAISSATLLAILEQRRIQEAEKQLQEKDRPTLNTIQHAYRRLWHASEYGKTVLAKSTIKQTLLSGYHHGMWMALKEANVFQSLRQLAFVRIVKKKEWLA